MFSDLVAVIPARKTLNSTECLIDNELIKFDSLIVRKIRQLRLFLPKTQVVVCTESNDLAALATNAGATVLQRPSKLSRKDAAISDVVEFVAHSLDFTHIAWVPYVTPFFDSTDYRESFEAYFQNVRGSCKYDSLLSVVEEKKFLWSDTQPLNYDADKTQLPSERLNSLYSACNGNYMAPRQVMLERKYYLGERVYLDRKPNHCSIDIKLIKAFHDVNGYQTIVRKLF